MKFIKKIVVSVFLLTILAVIAVYMIGQTRWAAGWLGNLVSNNSEYRLSVAKITHSWSKPREINLEEVTFSQANQEPLLVARQITLVLSVRQLTEPRSFDNLILRDGTLNLLPSQNISLPVQAGTLQLINMALQFSDEHWKFNAQKVNAGITPWQQKAGYLLGESPHFQFSAGSMTLNDVPISQVIVQGERKQNRWILSDVGATLAQGDLTGVAQLTEDGSWLLERLRLSDVRLQTPLTLEQFWENFSVLPQITVERFDLINARLEGQQWAINDLDLSLQNVSLQHGNWSSQDGVLDFNASDFINGSFHLTDPIMNAQFSPTGLAITQFTTRWEGSLLRTSGNWLRTSKRLQLDEFAMAALEYSLPANWRSLWLQPLPSWLAEVYISKMTTNRNLIIDINPDFPFQITALDGYGSNLLLAKNNRWGIWSGSLKLNASGATFNRIDLRRPSLALEANEQQITLAELSAFMPEGLLEATASISQLPSKPFTFSLTGRSVPLNTLQQWGWQPVLLEGNGNLQLQLQGLLNSEGTFKSSLKGQLQATSKDGQTLQQQLP